MVFNFNRRKGGSLKEVLFCIGLVGVIILSIIGCCIGAIVGCIVGTIALPMMILDGRIINPVEVVSSILDNVTTDKI